VVLVGIGMIGEGTPGFCSLAEAYGVSVRRLCDLGVVGEINYQPFDAAGRIVERPELRALMRRVLAVEGDRLRALARSEDRHVVAVGGGPAKVPALRGALEGRFMNVLVTDEAAASELVNSGGASTSLP
jgi:DNA-binding transcriptional regulator LsrR (DeoR family)